MNDVTTSEMDESPSPLLTIPDGVENLLLSFVSCGDGGVQRILNLRQVCSTTRSWVDNLPKRQADVVFAKAQVAMDSDEDSVSRFLTSPPPFGVTALSLQVDDLYEPEESSSEEEESSSSEEEDRRVDEATWSSFCAFWNFKLETLNVKTRGRYCEFPFNCRLVGLMESPNLLRLQFCNSPDLLRDDSLTTSCFQKVRELHIGGFYNGHSVRNQFFAQLENNSNLSVLSVSPACEEDFLGYAKVIDRKKDDTRLQLTFNLEDLDMIKFPAGLPTPGSRIGKFVASIVASRSQIRLKLSDMGFFDQMMTELLSHAACRQLYTKIESIDSWRPTEETLSLMESLPLLKILLGVVTKNSSVDFDQLTFPPSLEELGFSSGFPARQHLPQFLTSLRLDEYESDVEGLVSSLNFLSRRCPKLTSLTIQWKYVYGKSTQIFKETPPPQFSNLRKLSFRGKIGVAADVEDCRSALLCGFHWRSLQLNFLHLFCANVDRGYLYACPVVNEEILRNLSEGPSAKTLLTIEVQNEWVTPEGLPLLEKLRSLAAENWKEREEREGRGGQWRTLYGPGGWYW